MVHNLFGSIPSPSSNTISIGPFDFRMYGLCIALGVVAAIWISTKRWEARGGDPADIGAIAMWAVPAGVIGARLYHVATDWKTYQGQWGEAFKIWQGGLGIPGGIALGVIVGAIVAKRRKLDVVDLLDVVAPAIPVAQAIGRLGNWFNQELFGGPTTLPWGLEVSPERVLEAGYPPGTLFHPTFLYEALWNLALAGGLVLLDRTKKLYKGELFMLYVLGYALGRLWVEDLRIDPASLIWGVRVNIWMAGIVAVVTIALFAARRLRTHPADSPADATVASADVIHDRDDADERDDSDATSGPAATREDGEIDRSDLGAVSSSASRTDATADSPGDSGRGDSGGSDSGGDGDAGGGDSGGGDSGGGGDGGGAGTSRSPSP